MPEEKKWHNITSSYPGEDTSTKDWKEKTDAMYANMSPHEFYEPESYWEDLAKKAREKGTHASRTLEEYFPCLDDGCCSDDIEPHKIREALESLQHTLAVEAATIARKNEVDPVTADLIRRKMLIA